MVNIDGLEEKTDEELVKLTLENPDYYYLLMKRYEDKIFRYIMRISGVPKEDVEDILQDVFLSAYKNINDFDTNLKFSSWLYRIAHNKTISFWRKVKVRPKTITTDDDEIVLHLASNEDIAKELNRKMEAEELRKALNSLNENYREVLMLKFIEDKSYQEISDILEKPMGTVATLINRAKKQFREMANKGEIL